MPERKAETLSEAQQERYFDYVIHPQDNSEQENVPGEQGNLTDF